jgi:predicted anti-sigma-YlaC factor YlaD
MNTCADRRETLLLDVYGELPGTERPAWEAHLETCAGCRAERQELVRLLEVARESMVAPALPPEKAERLRHSITRGWMAEQPATRWWHGLLVGARLRPVPALAAVCLLVVVLGWFGLRGFQVRSLNGLVGEAPERIIVSDVEIIENLDLLEDMDDIEQVVRVVDDRNIVL